MPNTGVYCVATVNSKANVYLTLHNISVSINDLDSKEDNWLLSSEIYT